MGNDIKKKLLLRIPAKIWTKLKRQAGKNNRSLTAEIVTILEDSQIPTGGTTTTSSGADNTVTINSALL